MAAPTSPSLMSTSQTLTAAPTMAPAPPTAELALHESLQPANRHAFLQPSAAIATGSLGLVKETLEGFAAQVGEQQERRLKESRKRKRGGAGDTEVLKLRKVYVDVFDTAQVWQQAKRIIGGVLNFAETALDELEESRQGAATAAGDDGGEEPKTLTFGQDGFEVGTDGEEGSGDSGAEEESASDDQEDAHGLADHLDGEAESADNIDGQDDGDEDDGAEGQEYVEDPNGLNDGFFSIDDFNRQTQWFEEQDARGDPTADQASDDEEIDWGADPLAPTKGGPKSAKRRPAGDEPLSDEDDEAEDEAEDEDDGPTFGDMALDAPEGESEDEALGDGQDDDAEFNANDIYYKDFFAPPPKTKGAARPKKSVTFGVQEPGEKDVERAMADVRRDLFDDESENEGSDDALSDVSAGDPKSRRSAHERRQAKLAEEIRRLEAASVAKREWTLSGEAAAADRPLNSLLEEDVDFEHVGKPVPVITPEVSEGIEELIKRRILAKEFDEVIRRRPDADSVPTGARRGLVELDDSKPSKSLAEVYEEEHVRKANPDAYVSQSDEKLQREEREVEALWKDVCARLDALSSWHYRPKPAAPALAVVADVAAVSIEDAQPAAAQGIAAAGSASRLAPQEVYRPGAADAAAPGEVVTRGGLPVARREMSREERVRARRRRKERVRKAGGAAGPDAAEGPRARMRRETLADLKKGGVKVINRRGEVTDVDGNKARAAKGVSSGSLKL